jgi:hypothetical protein
MSAANRSSAPIRFSSPSPRASMFHDSAGEARHESLRRCSVRLALLRWNRSDGSCPSRVRHPRQDHARLGAPVTYSLCAAAASRVTAHHHGDVARGRPLSSLGSSVLRREDRVQDRDARGPPGGSDSAGPDGQRHRAHHEAVMARCPSAVRPNSLNALRVRQ